MIRICCTSFSLYQSSANGNVQPNTVLRSARHLKRHTSPDLRRRIVVLEVVEIRITAGLGFNSDSLSARARKGCHTVSMPWRECSHPQVLLHSRCGCISGTSSSRPIEQEEVDITTSRYLKRGRFELRLFWEKENKRACLPVVIIFDVEVEDRRDC